MSLNIRIVCDSCAGESYALPGTPTDVRVLQFSHGWFYDGTIDICPRCTGKDLRFWDSEPF